MVRTFTTFASWIQSSLDLLRSINISWWYPFSLTYWFNLISTISAHAGESNPPLPEIVHYVISTTVVVDNVRFTAWQRGRAGRKTGYLHNHSPRREAVEWQSILTLSKFFKESLAKKFRSTQCQDLAWGIEILVILILKYEYKILLLLL